ESMVRDLVEQSVNLVKEAKNEEVKEKAALIVEDILLDILIPPVKGHSFSPANGSSNFDPDKASEQELNEKTREKFREKLQNGELEERKIEINVKQAMPAGIGMIGNGMMDDASMAGRQGRLRDMRPKTREERRLTIREARKVLREGEACYRSDFDEVKEEASRLPEENGSICIGERY